MHTEQRETYQIEKFWSHALTLDRAIWEENSKEYACDLYVDCDDVSRDFIAQALISKKKRNWGHFLFSSQGN